MVQVKKNYSISPDDIGESNDLSAQHPDIVKRLSKELGTYLRKVDAQRPTVKLRVTLSLAGRN